MDVLLDSSETIKNDFLNENGKFYSEVLKLIERSSGPGDKNEEDALEYLKILKPDQENG